MTIITVRAFIILRMLRALIMISIIDCVDLIAKACSDGIQSQGETGVDCGGLCKPCGKINKIVNNRI